MSPNSSPETRSTPQSSRPSIASILAMTSLLFACTPYKNQAQAAGLVSDSFAGAKDEIEHTGRAMMEDIKKADCHDTIVIDLSQKITPEGLQTLRTKTGDLFRDTGVNITDSQFSNLSDHKHPPCNNVEIVLIVDESVPLPAGEPANTNLLLKNFPLENPPLPNLNLGIGIPHTPDSDFFDVVLECDTPPKSPNMSVDWQNFPIPQHFCRPISF